MASAQGAEQRLAIVSNRLPVVLNQQGDGSRAATPGPGRMVMALAPVPRERGGIWSGDRERRTAM